MPTLTPLSAVVGGALIALAAAGLLLATGRIAGVSGILGGLAEGAAARPTHAPWRGWFVAGMLGAGAAFAVVAPATFAAARATPVGLAAAAGLLVGVGARLGNGCTSGHGICGVSRRSPRSLVATGTFFVVAVLTATALGGRS